jgi:hypothetical protein
MSADELKAACLEARRTFYSWPSIIRRAANWRGNLTNPVKAGAYLYVNWQLRSEIDEKNDLPLGNQPIRPEPMELSNAVQLLL